VPQGTPPAPADLSRVFPWLARTVTSEGARTVTPLSAHALQCWWGMPRRIRLDFTTAVEGAVCDITGHADSVTVASWRQRPHGVKYETWGLTHPLSPHYTAKAGSEWLPVHPQPGGIGYRHWLGLVMRSLDGLARPAGCVSLWREARQLDAGDGSARLLAAGFDMDNMKARSFVESEMPLPAAATAAIRDLLDEAASRLVGAASLAARLLRQGVRNALFSAGATVKLDAELLAAARERLWDATEPAFYAALERVAAGGAAVRGAELEGWQRLLHRDALALFDESAPITPDSFATAPRISRARRNLHFALTGFGKDGAALFDLLSLPPAEPRGKPKGKAA
jgi:CRISPR system Cascade subunit CasA